jgi:acyl-CoA dehydrogenase family protein 9
MPVAANWVFRRTSKPHLSLVVVQNYSHNVSQEVVPDKSKSAEPLSIKKQQKFPFVKNLFLGKFDHDVLTYPEVLDKERLQTLSELVSPIERFFSEGDSFSTIFCLMIILSFCHTTATTTSNSTILGGNCT